MAAGAVGLKLHEDWGTTPAAIDCCLTIAEETDIQVGLKNRDEQSCRRWRGKQGRDNGEQKHRQPNPPRLRPAPPSTKGAS